MKMKQMSYYELLSTRIWREKRQQILYRDGFKCQNCGKIQDKELHLHIHHKVYRTYQSPILQENKDLITLCENCHEKHHQNNDILILDNKEQNVIQDGICYKCKGTGYLPKYNYYHDGECFNCMGTGKKIPKHLLYWNVKRNDYPGITYNINPSSVEINKTIEKLKELPNINQFETFLNKLKLLIEYLHLSTFDESLLIAFNPLPDNPDYPNIPLIRSRIGNFSYLGHPRPKYKNEPQIISGSDFWEPDNINERFEEIKEEYCQSYLGEPLYDYAFDAYPSRILKNKHNHVVYKMAIDKSFQNQILQLLLRNTLLPQEILSKNLKSLEK